MTVSMPGKAVVAVLVTAGVLCGCASSAEKKDPTVQTISKPTYKPTGSHIVERSDGKRSPKNSSSAPVQTLENSPAVTVIQNQPPK
jgi:type IV pilus biogenesis protein CpaD/CtpE